MPQGPMWTSVPLEDAEGAEAGGVGEGVGFRDPAAGLDRLEITNGCALGPCRAAFGDERVESVAAQPLRLCGVRARGRQLVDRTSQVMSCLPRSSSTALPR